MSNEQKKIRSAVRRNHAKKYLLTSLVAFSVTIIVTRVFLQITGFPQLGNSVLRIAHALWGGLLLIIAVLLPLAYANRWAIQVGALLGGIGIGLFIDEVSKFITQANDYFFPPALPLIYGFILLNVVVYLYFRRPHQEDPRNAMYNALDGLQDALDGDLDANEAIRIEAQLAIAKQSDRNEIMSLANTISTYLQKEKRHLIASLQDVFKNIGHSVQSMLGAVQVPPIEVLVTTLINDITTVPEPFAVADFLDKSLGLTLDAKLVTALENRTAGWVAGLQMAALSMQQRSLDGMAEFIESFTGSHRYVIDYLTYEVLSQQHEALRQFLMQTAILDRMSTPLCDAVFIET